MPTAQRSFSGALYKFRVSSLTFRVQTLKLQTRNSKSETRNLFLRGNHAVRQSERTGEEDPSCPAQGFPQRRPSPVPGGSRLGKSGHIGFSFGKESEIIPLAAPDFARGFTSLSSPGCRSRGRGVRTGRAKSIGGKTWLGKASHFPPKEAGR